MALPDDIRTAPSLALAAERLGGVLGLEGAAPEDATRRALADDRFARALMGARRLPGLRDMLLAMPAASAAPSATPSAGRLVAKAAGAVLKWGMDGLRPAEPWVIRRRLEACNACPFQAPAPGTLIYRGAKVVAGKDAKICTSCHCLTNTKAAISTEHCPERAPGAPDQSRWGEQWIEPDAHPKGPW